MKDGSVLVMILRIKLRNWLCWKSCVCCFVHGIEFNCIVEVKWFKSFKFTLCIIMWWCFPVLLIHFFSVSKAIQVYVTVCWCCWVNGNKMSIIAVFYEEIPAYWTRILLNFMENKIKLNIWCYILDVGRSDKTLPCLEIFSVTRCACEGWCEGSHRCLDD